MSIDKKRVEEIESKYKDNVFGKISEMSSKQFESIRLMTANATNLGQSQVRIPNASITLNNKLVELLHIFKEKGLSIFYKEFIDDNYVGASFLGDAIIHDLMEKLELATDRLSEYGKKIEEFSKKKNEKILALQNGSIIKKFFLKIRAFFVPLQYVEFSLTKEEKEILENSLQEYKEIDSEICNYNLEDNIVQSLVKGIAGSQKLENFDIKHKYRASTVPGLLEECVIPDLKKLGLERLVPKLQEDIIEEYKKDLADPEINQEKDIYLYIPDFSKEQNQICEFKEEELQDKLQQVQETINRSKKALKSTKRGKFLERINLKNFQTNDLIASVPKKELSTEILNTELWQVQEKESKKSDKDVEKDEEIVID